MAGALRIALIATKRTAAKAETGIRQRDVPDRLSHAPLQSLPVTANDTSPKTTSSLQSPAVDPAPQLKNFQNGQILRSGCVGAGVHRHSWLSELPACDVSSPSVVFADLPLLRSTAATLTYGLTSGTEQSAGPRKNDRTTELPVLPAPGDHGVSYTLCSWDPFADRNS